MTKQAVKKTVYYRSITEVCILEDAIAIKLLFLMVTPTGIEPVFQP
jgi:hypothetical protein